MSRDYISGLEGGISPTVLEFEGIDLSQATGDQLAGAHALPYDGRIVRVEAVVTTVTAGGDATGGSLNLELAGTNAVGGVVTITNANAGTVGTAIAGTAISQNFNSGDDLDIEWTQASGAFTQGVVTLRVYIEFNPEQASSPV